MKRTILVVLLLVVSLLAVPALAQDTQGEARGMVVRTHSHVGVQLLRSFYFRFSSSDRHIRDIRLSPDTPSVNRMTIQYQDNSQDDVYNYRIVHHDTSYAGIRTYRYGREICKGSCIRSIPRPSGDYIFVLRGFYLYYHGTDHEIDQVGIRENNGNLTVAFNDKNDDDTFIWEVDYAYVPRALVQSMGTRGGTARGAQRQFIPTGIAVIRGFDFNFRSGDHHIKEVGALLWGDGRLDVFYSDRNGDDEFDWSVRWAVVN
jgi:hypothetical protein